ncbi:Arc family DNA-binding protein [Sinorhizobium meliloti]|nr:Arc family DNA-binding protein [Sinorhizobium meliloti]MDW9828704.1 Arc family DNA-binding protein [Sinorhizobium meliloti]MDX0199081.1 Arc family DNA-binding protein [Sinorhizobium meliloti]MDX0236528.1 Arc family DNA-binding protein [Sinorhizobium meliloti]MDX0273465.1 Arc family DNA-binding protein [Sinorhizobium meliloti]
MVLLKRPGMNMDTASMTKEEEIRITLRLAASLRDKLSRAADGNERSMNGEIVARLENSFESNVDPKALTDAFAIAEDMRSRVEQQWNYLQEVERKLLEERKQISEQLRAKRAELAHHIWERRARVREELERKEERVREMRERYIARSEALQEREKELNDAIARFNAREKELGEVVRSLTKGADMLVKR